MHKKVNVDLDLHYPFEELKETEAPRNKDVFLHLKHFMETDTKSKSTLENAKKLMVDLVKASCIGKGPTFCWQVTRLSRNKLRNSMLNLGTSCHSIKLSYKIHDLYNKINY